VYSILKSISGQEFTYHRKPSNVCEGIYRGILGGTSEVYEGVTGIVTKPYQGARSKGVFGCCKGVGKGICGVIVAPFTSCLRCCTTFSQGVNQTAIQIKKGRQPTFGRFRFPRYINPRNVLEPYDDGYARASHILMTIKRGKYGKENLLFFQDFVIYNKFKRTNKSGTLILTNKSVLF
jgi:vacuolar protein sorting-associated protein 13A/C